MEEVLEIRPRRGGHRSWRCQRVRIACPNVLEPHILRLHKSRVLNSPSEYFAENLVTDELQNAGDHDLLEEVAPWDIM
eukprot:7056556-Prorocentrum_lima.AAC.1